jgi:hypothetical protein
MALLACLRNTFIWRMSVLMAARSVVSLRVLALALRYPSGSVDMIRGNGL